MNNLSELNYQEISELKFRIEQIKKDIENTSVFEVSNILTKLDQVTTDVSLAVETVDRMQSTINTHTSNIQTNSIEIQNNKQEIESNKENIKINENNISNNSEKILKNQDDINSLGQFTTALTNEFSRINSEQITQGNQIKENSQSITNINTEIATNQSNILINQQNIATNTDNINTLTETQNYHSSELERITPEIFRNQSLISQLIYYKEQQNNKIASIENVSNDNVIKIENIEEEIKHVDLIPYDELDFIIKGNYFLNSQIDEILNGTY